MRSILAILTCLSAVALCLLCASGDVASAGGLVLELEVPKTEYLVDEPFYATATLVNTGPGEACILPYLDPAVGLLSVEISRPGHGPDDLEPRLHIDLGTEGLAEAVICLPADDWFGLSYDFTSELTVPEGMREPVPAAVLRIPGEYRFSARYSIPADWPAGPVDVLSNEVVLYVHEPEGEDRVAHALLEMGPRTGDRGPWNVAREQAETYEALLRETPGSAYTIYAEYRLAQLLDYHGTRAPGRHVRPVPGADDVERIEALYDSVRHRAGDTPFGVHVAMHAARGAARRGNRSRARDILTQVILSPAATENDSRTALAWLEHTDSGMFERGSATPKGDVAQLMLPLRACAEALGLSVSWNHRSKEAVVSSSKLRASLRPGRDEMVVNGVVHTGVPIALRRGSAEVSPSAMTALMVGHYGGDFSSQDPILLATAAGVPPPG